MNRTLDPETVGEILRPLIYVWGIPARWEEVAVVYWSVLGQIPRFALKHAVDRVLAEYKYPEFPRPAEILDRLPDVYHQISADILPAAATFLPA